MIFIRKPGLARVRKLGKLRGVLKQYFTGIGNVA